MTDSTDSFHRSLDAALERTDPSSPEAYAWPTLDLSAPVAAVESAASLMARNQIAVRRLPEYDDSYLTKAQQQAFVEHYDEINLDAAQEEADAYLRDLGWTDVGTITEDDIARDAGFMEPETETIVVWGDSAPVATRTIALAPRDAEEWIELASVMSGLPERYFRIPICEAEISTRGTE